MEESWHKGHRAKVLKGLAWRVRLSASRSRPVMYRPSGMTEARISIRMELNAKSCPDGMPSYLIDAPKVRQSQQIASYVHGLKLEIVSAVPADRLAFPCKC